MKKIDEKKQEKNKKIIDRIIEIILIIIIILLLLHNCEMIRKNKNMKTPSGNVNIIEIKCDDNKCDTNDGSGGISVDTNTNRYNRNSGNQNAMNDNNSDDTIVPSDNSNNNNPNKGANTNPDEEEPSEDIPIVDDNEFSVLDRNIKWSDSSELKIFSNSFYNFEDKIAPESSNTYQFVVKNSTEYNLKYNMTFTEENTHNINLKYKLKKNNNYIVSEYVSFDQLNLTDQLINSKKNDTFYLEWKWISSSNDTEIGKIQANYKLYIHVEAESV